jgi:hypothetical protein
MFPGSKLRQDGGFLRKREPARFVGEYPISIREIACVNREDSAIGGSQLVDRAVGHAVFHLKKRAAVHQTAAGPAPVAFAEAPRDHARNIGLPASRSAEVEATNLAPK